MPAPNIALNDIILLSFRGTYQQQRILFTHTYAVTAVPASPTPAADFVEDFLVNIQASPTNLSGGYLSLMPTNYTLQEIRAQIVAPVRQVVQKLAIDDNGAANAASTGNLAAVITLNTALAGRSQVSNKHIGPIPSDATNGGSISVAYKNAMDVFGSLLTTTVQSISGSGTATPVIYHRTPPVGTAIYDEILNFVSQTTTRVMRRRTLGVGE